MFKRICTIITGLMMLASSAVNASDVSNYKLTWEYKALQLQGKIDFYAPLGKAAFITTHNSYNAGVYSQNGSYLDPNQKISLYDQLEIGVRALELDVHYTFSSSGFWPWEWTFSEELKLSHGNGDTGTHPNDRFFTQGLLEIRNWLNNNPNEVIILYLEDHMEGKYDKAISEMNGIIGDLVYKPDGCQSLPMDISKNDVLFENKQILLIGGNCATANWANYVFNGHFSATEGLENFSPYPVCTAGNKDADYIQSHLVRIYEDSTTLSSLFGEPGPPITAPDASAMARCGIGAIGLDQIVPYDSRLEAQIWSWGENEPNNAGGEDCATQRSDGRFNDLPCDLYRNVACKDPDTAEWFITSGTYNWYEAFAAIESEFPGQGLIFGVPVNGYENAKLQDLKTSMGISDVWLNYSDQDIENDWRPYYEGLIPLKAQAISLSLRSTHGKYIVAEGNGGGDVNANRSGIGSWEKFTMINADKSSSCVKDGDRIYMRTDAGYYYSAKSDGSLDADRKAAYSGEMFTVINHSNPGGCVQNGHSISLKSVYNKYVVAESNGAANANRSAIGSWERFTVVLH